MVKDISSRVNYVHLWASVPPPPAQKRDDGTLMTSTHQMSVIIPGIVGNSQIAGRAVRCVSKNSHGFCV